MADLASVSAVIVTRGNVDLTEILASLPMDDIIVWDNAKEVAAGRTDMKVYGRFLALDRARHDIVYTQDDDCLCPAADLIAAYEGTMLVNVPADEAPLTAWGAVFSRQSVEAAFARYLAVYPDLTDDDLLLGADLIHAYQTPWERLDLGRTDYEYAYQPDRMHQQDSYYDHRRRVVARVQELVGAA